MQHSLHGIEFLTSWGERRTGLHSLEVNGSRHALEQESGELGCEQDTAEQPTFEVLAGGTQQGVRKEVLFHLQVDQLRATKFHP